MKKNYKSCRFKNKAVSGRLKVQSSLQTTIRVLDGTNDSIILAANRWTDKVMDGYLV